MSGNPDLPRSAAGPNSPWLLAVVGSIATFMEVLDTTIANVAPRHIAGSLAARQDESTYILTSYLVSNAIILPISGWLPFIFIPLSAIQFTGVPPAQNPYASAIINLMRNLGGSFGVSIVTTQLAWRGQLRHERLGEHVTPYTGYGGTTSLTGIARQVPTQATILSYLDVFTILSLIALCAAPPVLFLPNLPKGAPAGGH